MNVLVNKLTASNYTICKSVHRDSGSQGQVTVLSEICSKDKEITCSWKEVSQIKRQEFGNQICKEKKTFIT